MNDDVLTRNDDGELAVRTVSATETSTVVNPNDVYTRDTDGNLAIRTVGGSGGGSGNVTSVNGKTGVVVLTAEDVSAVPQYETMPTASASNLGDLVQYIGESGETYTNGYFYKDVPETTPSSATISQTIGSGLTDLSVNVETFETAEQPSGNETVSFVCTQKENPETLVPTVVSGSGWGFSIDTEVFLNYLRNSYGHVIDFDLVTKFVITAKPDYMDDWGVAVYNNDTIMANVSVNAMSTSDGIDVYGFGQEQTNFDIEYTAAQETIWEKDNVPVTLSDYGISFTGTPSLNDELTVVYTATAISGYFWEQVNVQPAPEIPDVGIDWKTTVDLPVEYTGGTYDCAPYWTIEGGLPDGEYEFYISTKCNDSGELPIGEVVYKILVKIDNANNIVQGRMGYIFDGNYKNDMNYIFGSGVREFYSCFYKNNDDLFFTCRQFPFLTDIPDYWNPRVTISECWKMSAIKNVNTGQEYITTGTLVLNGTFPQFTMQMSGRIRLAQLSYETSIPNKTVKFSNPVQDFANKTVSFTKNAAYTVINIIHNESNSEFVAKVYGKKYGETFTPYSQEITKATGIFANSYMALNTSYMVLMGVDTITAAGLTGNVESAAGQITEEYTSYSFSTIPQVVTTIGQSGAQGGNLSAISADTLGSVVQYIGETNANYTNGYFYKSSGTVVTVPESITTNVYTPESGASVAFDTTNFINAVATLYGWTVQQVREYLINYANSEFRIGYDIDNSSINDIFLPWWGNVSDASVLQYVSVTYTGGGQGYLNIFFNETYTPESQSVQNPSWDLVNVQPTYTAPSTMPTLAVADWNNSTQTVNVTGVTATNAVIISPAPASAAEYASCGVLCTAQGSGTLTFTCQSTPTNDLIVNVIIL